MAIQFTLTESLKRRFEEKFEKTAGCWGWSGCKTKKGYGQIGAGGRRGKVLYAHRVAYMLHKGDIPDGLDVCHECDNPSCVNPDHLFVGTRKVNMEDAAKKGRMSSGPRHQRIMKRVAARGDRNGSRTRPDRVPRGDNHPFRRRPEIVPRGEKQGNAKLSDVQAQEILDRVMDGELQKDLATEFCVSRATVSGLVSGKKWKHLRR